MSANRSILTRVAVPLLVAGAAAACVVGCGGVAAGGGGDASIVRVGASAVTKAALTRLITQMAPEQIAPDPPRFLACVKHQEAISLAGSSRAELERECEQQYQSLKRQALSLLISSYWLIEEASAEGVKVSGHEVAAWLGDRSRTLPSSGSAGGEVELEARARLSAAKLRDALSKREPRITSAQVAAYYRQHPQQFERPELRYVDLAENYGNRATAQTALNEFRSGARQIATDSLHELLVRTTAVGAYSARKQALEALFAAKPHVLSGPILLNVAYSVFEVTRIIPPTRLSLASVKQSIHTQLQREQQQRELERFVRSWRAKWTARTDCSPGYVVQKCRQYRGAMTPESPHTLD